VRLSVNSELSDAQLWRVVHACAEIRDEVGVDDWPSTRRAARRPPPAARTAA